MNVGIHIVSFTPAGGPAAIGPTLTEVARVAEEAGVTNLSLMDHYLQLGGRIGSADEPMLEGYTTLGYLAASTSTVELQLLVTGVTYRHPGLLAKIVSTLDVLSGGPCSASVPRGTSGNTTRSASQSRHWLSGSNVSRRPYRWSTRCGATTPARMRCVPNQRSVTATRNAALLGKCR